VGAVDLLAAGALPAAEQLRQVQVLEVVRLVDARHLGREGVLEREVGHLDPLALDRPVAGPHREPDPDPRNPLEQRAGHRAGPPVEVAPAGTEWPAGPGEIGPDPVVLLRVSEEEILLISVLEPRQGRGQADHDLLDASEPPGAQAGVDADAERRQLNLILSSVTNPRRPSLGRIFFPSSRLRAT
jgi:hypothetical protein